MASIFGFRWGLPATLCIALALVSASYSQEDQSNVAVLRSTGARGQLSPERVALALQLAADELKLNRDLPRVVVVLGCKQSAAVAELPAAPAVKTRKLNGAIIVEGRGDHNIYYLWLLSDPTDETLAQGIVEILINYSGRPVAAIPAAISRTTAKLRAQVSLRDLHKGY